MKKVLLLDMDEDLKNSFRLVFPKDEYQIMHAASGKDGLDLAFKEKPDIFIVNLKLKDMKGEEFLKALKDKGYKKGRFYFLRDEGDKEDISHIEVDGVIEKPINYLAVHGLLLERAEKGEILMDKREERVLELFKSSSHPSVDEKFLELRDQIEAILRDVIEEAHRKATEMIEPLIRTYIQWYVEKRLPYVAERILKEKIDEMIKLLKK